jgi:hypothetical protein
MPDRSSPDRSARGRTCPGRLVRTRTCPGRPVRDLACPNLLRLGRRAGSAGLFPGPAVPDRRAWPDRTVPDPVVPGLAAPVPWSRGRCCPDRVPGWRPGTGQQNGMADQVAAVSCARSAGTGVPLAAWGRRSASTAGSPRRRPVPRQLSRRSSTVSRCLARMTAGGTGRGGTSMNGELPHRAGVAAGRSPRLPRPPAFPDDPRARCRHGCADPGRTRRAQVRHRHVPPGTSWTSSAANGPISRV